MKKIFLIIFLILFLFPFFVQAKGLVPCGGYKSDANGNYVTQPISKDPVTGQLKPVPAGWRKISETEMAELQPPCQLCHVFVLFNNIIRFVMFTLVPVVAVLMLVISGVMFFFAGSMPALLIQARGIITSVFIGLLIIFSAWVIVNTVLAKSGVVEAPSLLKWYEINCPTE